MQTNKSLARCSKCHALGCLYTVVYTRGRAAIGRATTMAPGPTSARREPPFKLRREWEMTRTELLDTALKNLAQVVKLLDRAEEDELADDALELAERVNFRMQSSCHMRPL